MVPTKSCWVRSTAVQGLSGGQRLDSFWWYKGVLTRLLVCWIPFFAPLGVAIMFLSSSDKVPSGIPPAHKPFSRLAAFAQQLRSSGLSLGHAIQYASNIVSNLLFQMDSGRVRLQLSLILGWVWRVELVCREYHRWGNHRALYSNLEVNIHQICQKFS